MAIPIVFQSSFPSKPNCMVCMHIDRSNVRLSGAITIYIQNIQGMHMGSFRLPGPICRVLGALDIDTGTLCRSASPVPGIVIETKQKNDNASMVAPDGREHVLKDPETYIGDSSYQNVKGNHECVAFAQMAGGAPHTSNWKPGLHVEPGMAITRGTWVATFLNGNYSGHVGAFDSMDKEGNLTLIDQFNSRGSVDKTTYHVKKQPYTGRVSNDPSRYYVVLW